MFTGAWIALTVVYFAQKDRNACEWTEPWANKVTLSSGKTFSGVPLTPSPSCFDSPLGAIVRVHGVSAHGQGTPVHLAGNDESLSGALLQMMTSGDHLGEVPCDNSANEWRKCVEANLGDKAVHKRCETQRNTFDVCVDRWREVAGPAAKIKGENEGDPPEQCAAMSCLVGECLRKYNYDFERCKPPMDYFKHCVKKFYGTEYVME